MRSVAENALIAAVFVVIFFVGYARGHSVASDLNCERQDQSQ